jgi:diacylglycerol kinase family enzyme
VPTDRLLRRSASHLTRPKTSHLHVTHDGDLTFGLDGETVDSGAPTVDSDPGAVRFHAGSGYDTDPVAWSTRTPQ